MTLIRKGCIPRRFELSQRLGVVMCVCWLGVGCAATVKQAAETATPAAVEGAIDKASEPRTRDAVAVILEDPDIRASSSELSAALVQGAVRGVQSEVQLSEVRRLTDALVTSVGASLARSLERDVAPQISNAVARVLDESFERALNARTEERLQAMVGSVTRATLSGASEAVSDVAADAHPALRQALAQVTHDVVYNGALGFENAVRDAHSGDLAHRSGPSVLAGIGILARWVYAIPPLLVGGGLLVVLGLVAGLVWALLTLRNERRLVREQSSVNQPRSTNSLKPSAPGAHAG